MITLKCDGPDCDAVVMQGGTVRLEPGWYQLWRGMETSPVVGGAIFCSLQCLAEWARVAR